MIISIVFSFRNEEENIPELVKRVSDSVSTIQDSSCEMIFVNDDSSDGSYAVLKGLQAKYPITIINMSRRFGVMPCVMAGLSHARGDAIIYMDSDLQDPPEIIPEMVDKYREGADVVHTTRLSREGESGFKMAVTKLAYKIINRLSDITLPENTGDFKLMSSKVVKEIVSLKEYDPYMRGLSIWVGYRQDFVYYNREPRWKGNTKFPLFSKGPVTEFIRGITAYSAAPLYISLLLGLFAILVAMLLIIYAVVVKYLGVSAPGASGVLIAMSFFNGMVLVTNGIMGIYISKIYYDVKSRPKYIIKSVDSPENK